MPGITKRADGAPLEPDSGILPVCKQLSPGRVAVVGTGFYITRYGLFATAKHVLEALVNWHTRTVDYGFVLHYEPPALMRLRNITSATFSTNTDVAIGQAENRFRGSDGTVPPNLRGRLSLSSPAPGEQLITYAYPENEVLDFTDPAGRPTLRGDYFDGTFLRNIQPSERPYVPYPHFETSLPVRSGASGAPVFDSRGSIVGIACRSWEFLAEPDLQHLSSVIPMSYFLPLEVGCAQIPPGSWEESQTPPNRRGQVLTFGELIAYNHIDVGQRGTGAA